MKTSFLIVLSLLLVLTQCLHYIPLERKVRSKPVRPSGTLKTLSQISDNQFDALSKPTTNMNLYANVVLVGNVTIGTPPQQISVQFDTGSATLWVPSGLNYDNDDDRPLFQEDASTSYEDSRLWADANYMGGDVQGFVGKDVVSTAGLTVQGMRFISASEITNEQYVGQMDGILGLGFPSLAIDNTDSFLDLLIQQGELSDQSFSFYNSGDNSKIIFGGVDDEYYTGDISYYPIISENYWAIGVDSIAFAGQNWDFSDGTQLTTVIDSGTTGILLPDAVYDAAIAATYLDPEAFYEPAVVDDLPDITITIGSNSYVIPPKAYMQSLIDEDGDEALYLGLSKYGDDSTLLLGELFLQTVYTHFDYANMRIGFAQPV